MRFSNKNPLVSVIIPVYNGSQYLNDAIDSVLNQTYKNIEVIVINDGSNDQGATEKMALSYQSKISYFKKENGGVASALNFGIEKMKGEFFSWLSHDDIYLPKKIEKQIFEMSKHEKNTILYSDHGFFKNNPRHFEIAKLPFIKQNYFRYWLTIENNLHGCTLLIPRSAFTNHELFNTSLKTTQDYAMWFSLSKNYNFIHIPHITVLGRIHPEQCTTALSDIVRQERDELITYFINTLQPHEIIMATQKNLCLSYQEIAMSCFKRGLIRAHLRAVELAESQSSGYAEQQPKKINLVLGKKIKSGIKSTALFLLPKNIYTRLTFYRYILCNFLSKNKNSTLTINLQDKFTEIYQKNLFLGKKSRSGEGSNLVQTEMIRNEIPKIIKKYQILSFLDAPCGDWYWMQWVNLGTSQYIGVDIVSELIEKNKSTYGNDSILFQKLNLVSEDLPRSDLIFSRDCFVHLSFDDIFKALKNFKRSGAKYLLTTTFTNRKTNLDLKNMFWRTLNLEQSPFHFPKPLELINENCSEDNGNYNDKCLGLWLLSDITL